MTGSAIRCPALRSTSNMPFIRHGAPTASTSCFGFSSAGGSSLGWIRADGAGEIQRLLDSKNLMNPYSFFPDGRRLAYLEVDPGSGFDLWTLAIDVSDPDHPKPGKADPFLRTPSNEISPAVSPDGHWIAYQSDESGNDEVYVRPFPPGPAQMADLQRRGPASGLVAQRSGAILPESGQSDHGDGLYGDGRLFHRKASRACGPISNFTTPADF